MSRYCGKSRVFGVYTCKQTQSIGLQTAKIEKFVHSWYNTHIILEKIKKGAYLCYQIPHLSLECYVWL